MKAYVVGKAASGDYVWIVRSHRADDPASYRFDQFNKPGDALKEAIDLNGRGFAVDLYAAREVELSIEPRKDT